MTNKTPYEIRQELLSLAKDRLSTEYFAKLEETRASGITKRILEES
jgi:hypothetical protein